MTEIGVGFGVALAGAGALAALSPQRAHTLPCVAMMVAGWVAAILISPHVEQPRDLMIYPAMDVMFGVAIVHMFASRPATWKLALAFCFLTQVLIHSIFMVVSFGWGFSPERLYRYQLAVNIVLGISIFCTSWPGIANVVGLILGSLLPVFGVRRGMGAREAR